MLLTSTLAVAAPIKTYQVTGPVLEVTDTTITVEKDKEKWQITRDKDTKVTGELKPGLQGHHPVPHDRHRRGSQGRRQGGQRRSQGRRQGQGEGQAAKK